MSRFPREERLRGQAGVERRRRVLERDPLCPDCLAQGIVREAEEVDHVLALHLGGKDDESNLVGRCREHHAAKTARERGWRVKRRIDPLTGWPEEQTPGGGE